MTTINEDRTGRISHTHLAMAYFTGGPSLAAGVALIPGVCAGMAATLSIPSATSCSPDHALRQRNEEQVSKHGSH